METFFILLIVGLFALAIFGFVLMASQAQKRSDIASRIGACEEFDASLTAIKMSVESIGPIGIALDMGRRKALLISGDRLIPVNARDILESEVICDGKSVTKTSRGSQLLGAAVGGALLGGAGLIVGGLSGSKSTEQNLKGVKLKLLLRNDEFPVFVIDFIELTSTGSTLPKVAVKEATSLHDHIRVLISSEQLDHDSVKKSLNNLDGKNSRSISEELEKLIEMKKSGFISEDQFETAKIMALAVPADKLDAP